MSEREETTSVHSGGARRVVEGEDVRWLSMNHFFIDTRCTTTTNIFFKSTNQIFNLTAEISKGVIDAVGKRKYDLMCCRDSFRDELQSFMSHNNQKPVRKRGLRIDRVVSHQ